MRITYIKGTFGTGGKAGLGGAALVMLAMDVVADCFSATGATGTVLYFLIM